MKRSKSTAKRKTNTKNARMKAPINAANHYSDLLGKALMPAAIVILAFSLVYASNNAAHLFAALVPRLDTAHADVTGARADLDKAKKDAPSIAHDSAKKAVEGAADGAIAVLAPIAAGAPPVPSSAPPAVQTLVAIANPAGAIIKSLFH